MFGSAKSTISEDMFDLGSVESIAGSTGGIRFVPGCKKEKVKSVLNSLCQDLSNSQRILPGGYLYMLDIIYDPKRIFEIGSIFAGQKESPLPLPLQNSWGCL